jgi:hypothetical protein
VPIPKGKEQVELFSCRLSRKGVAKLVHSGTPVAMRRLAIGCLSVAGLAVLVVGLLVGVHIREECTSGKVSECNYKKVKDGMTVKEAEAILGPSRQVGMQYIPGTRDGAVVSGERFFMWAKGVPTPMSSRAVWVGVKNGKICSKWY